MSSLTGQVSAIANRARLWLEQHSRLAAGARRELSTLAPGLLAQLDAQPVTALAISGPPGSGKSTMARLLAELLTTSGQATFLLSLDDYYLSLARRKQLALTQHPLLAHRGVPGTHDWPRLLRDLDALRKGQTTGLRLPVFDKSTDDIAAERDWRPVGPAPAVLIIEGWCIGAPAQADSELLAPINALEKEQDPEGAWRRLVNGQLAAYHADLRQRIDRYWYVSVPDWDCVVDWRWQQEQELTHPRLRSRQEVVAFLASFERIAAHMQMTCTGWADCLLACDRSHRIQITQ